MSNPFFSIVIPTCDRPNLLEQTLRFCLNMDFDDYEVVVSNNASGPETEMVLEKFAHNERLRVITIPERMGLIKHWNFFYTQCRGKYLIINCDDDGFTSSLLKRLYSILNCYRPKLISWNTGLYYHHGWEFDYGENILQYPAVKSGQLFELSYPTSIELFFRFGRKYFPETTRFCVSRQLCDELIERTGQLFWAHAVDYSTTLLMLGFIKESDYLYIDECLGWGGRSQVSNYSAMELSDKKRGNNARYASFFDEQSDIDLYPHHSLKIRAYHNASLQAMALYKHFFPEKLYGKIPDYGQFFFLTRMEMLEIGHKNVFFTHDQWLLFEKTVASMPAEFINQIEKNIISKIPDAKAPLERVAENIDKVVEIHNTAREFMGLSPTTPMLKILFDQEYPNIKKAYQEKEKVVPSSKWKDPVLQKGETLFLRLNDFEINNAFDLSMKWDEIVNTYTNRNCNHIHHYMNSGLIKKVLRMPDL